MHFVLVALFICAALTVVTFGILIGETFKRHSTERVPIMITTVVYVIFNGGVMQLFVDTQTDTLRWLFIAASSTLSCLVLYKLWQRRGS